MPMTSASSAVTLRKMMRRLRLENVTRTKRYQPCSSRAARRRRAFLSAGSFSPGRFGSTSLAKLSGVRLSTVGGLPVARPPLKTPPAFLGDQVLERSSSWAFQFLDDPSPSPSGLRRQIPGLCCDAEALPDATFP